MISSELIPKFWSEVAIAGPDECWIWTGNRHRNPARYGGCKTYGRFHVGKRVYVKSHRIAFTLEKGPIPDGMFVCHTCDNPGCVNPAHLFAGTAKDNRRDQDSKLRHYRGESVNTAKLTAEKVMAIIRAFEERKGEDGIYSNLGREFGVSNNQIHNIVKGRSWKHLKVSHALSSS